MWSSLANENLGTDVDGLLGSSAQVLSTRESMSRRLCGIIHRVEHTGTKAATCWRACMWSPCSGRSPNAASPTASRRREYCVQYRETDLDFLLRLMEERSVRGPNWLGESKSGC